MTSHDQLHIRCFSENLRSYGYFSRMWYFDVDKLLFLCKDGKERYLMVDERTLLIFVESLTDLPNVALPKVANVVFGVFDPTQKVSNSKTYTLYARGFLRIGGQELSFLSLIHI